MGKKWMAVFICMINLCCTPEVNTTLEINYTSIKLNLKILKSLGSTYENSETPRADMRTHWKTSAAWDVPKGLCWYQKPAWERPQGGGGSDILPTLPCKYWWKLHWWSIRKRKFYLSQSEDHNLGESPSGSSENCSAHFRSKHSYTCFWDKGLYIKWGVDGWHNPDLHKVSSQLSRPLAIWSGNVFS